MSILLQSNWALTSTTFCYIQRINVCSEMIIVTPWTLSISLCVRFVSLFNSRSFDFEIWIFPQILASSNCHNSCAKLNLWFIHKYRCGNVYCVNRIARKSSQQPINRKKYNKKKKNCKLSVENTFFFFVGLKH